MRLMCLGSNFHAMAHCVVAQFGVGLDLEVRPDLGDV